MIKTNIKMLEGKKLTDILVHFVDPEINIIFLVFSAEVYCVYGEKGSEILGVYDSSLDEIQGSIEAKYFKKFEPFNIFLNKRIIETREIGNQWNGHGYELSFENFPDKTMIIQSIYTANRPQEYEDCIKLGVCNYYYSFNE